MYFEGSEKKVELVAREGRFHSLPEAFWHDVVERAGAKILSKIASATCAAYLLSESSLFVWDDRVVMLTCGRTHLVRAAAHLIKHVGADHVDFFAYERKNEYFPHQQETDFFNDVEVLSEQVEGAAFRFGFPDEHHLYLFHMQKAFQPRPPDCTLELFMYNLQGQAQEMFSGEQTIERVRELTKLDRIFPGFEVDDYLFKPCGYSLNALKGDDYYTIHVTPEETGSYVSFETNVNLGIHVSETLHKVIDVFQPRSFDLIHFHPEHQMPLIVLPPYTQRNYVRQALSCGFEVGFVTHYMNKVDAQPAVRLMEEI